MCDVWGTSHERGQKVARQMWSRKIKEEKVEGRQE